MDQKAFIQTYGCQMNEHDSQRMTEILAKQGFAITRDLGEASLVLLNTCSVRRNPENKVYSFLGRLRQLKVSNPQLIVGVGGCVAQQQGENILKREKTVDMVFGPDNYFRLPEMLESVRQGQRVLMTKWLPRDKRIQNFIPEVWVEAGHVEGCKAYIAITKGCDNFCSFCIVPYTRGRLVCREPDNILREARHLVHNGAREIWLLGQNVNSYRVGDYSFHDLLDAVSQLEGLKRVRFTSPHPNDWDHRLSDLMAERPTVCNHLHLPFQAGSNRILKLMQRDHTIEEYLEKVRYMRAINPAIELTTDVIVGFPTETETDFQRTMCVLEEIRFSQIFPFKYSPRPKTKAVKMEDDVPREVKEERLRRVIELQERINQEQMEEYLGTTQEVLIDSAHPKKRHAMNGRTDGYRPVTVKGGDLDIGDLVTVRVTAYQGHWLESEVVAPAVAGV